MSDSRSAPPWWVPNFTTVIGLGLYAMTAWILYLLAPTTGQPPSELFKILAEAVVLTAFINGVVGSVYTISRDGQKKNETIAAQAKIIANQTGADPVAA
jgi:hypothetical protein